MSDKSEIPLYATQGGGTATFLNGKYVWVQPPSDFPEMEIGTAVPEEWGVVGINDLANEEAWED